MEFLLCWVIQTEKGRLRKAVVNGVLKVGIILRASVQNSLRTDRLRVLNVFISTRDCYIEAAIVLVHDNQDINLRVVLFRFFGIGSIAIFICNQEVRNSDKAYVSIPQDRPTNRQLLLRARLLQRR